MERLDHVIIYDIYKYYCHCVFVIVTICYFMTSYNIYNFITSYDIVLYIYNTSFNHHIISYY